jgi:pimeloyl-ACP methyl ester carboxylesterase
LKHFVLVHGAFHGAWCWEKVIPLLEKAGVSVSVLDLPGLGDDPRPAKDITLALYVDAVSKHINTLNGPVILVGHSMAGVVISQVAELMPDRIRTLIYVTAHCPGNGETLIQHAQLDKESLSLKYRQNVEEEGYTLMPAEHARACFYHLSEDSDVARAITRLKPQAMLPRMTPLSLSEANYDRVRRCYIACSEDRTITPPAQQAYMAKFPAENCLTLYSDHSPFYSCPEELVAALLKLSD